MSDYTLPDDLLYTAQDEWVRQNDDTMTVGITDYAQDQLGDIVFVELPEVGTTVTRDEPFGVIESVKAVSDLCAPVSGEVVAVNAALVDEPEIVNEDCYGDGWLIEINPSDSDELDDLMDNQAYDETIDEREGD